MAILSSPLSLLLSIPPFTRFFTAATIVFSSLHGWLWWTGKIQELASYFLMVPGSSLLRPWTFVTAALIETSIFGFIATIMFVPPSLRYLEKLWGSVELVKFVVVSVTISNVIAFGVNWIEYFIFGNADLFLYDMKYHGQLALQIALLVAFTQLIPEHQVQVMGVLKARVKTLPMAYLTISAILCIFGFQSPWILIQFGWYVGWVYLRFYKKNPGESLGGGDTYGDRSETFSLTSWFPQFMRQPLTILGNAVYLVAARLRLIPLSSSSDIESNGYNSVPVNPRAEAERRRAMALKALDQRLNSSSPPNHQSTASGPSQLSRSSSANRSDGSPSPNPPNPRTVDRKKSTSEPELAESSKAVPENR